jgi:endonuclease-8
VPEGDAVWRTARRLGALSGAELTASDFRVPKHATADLVGATVVETVSRGKHLLTRFSPTQDLPALTLHTHLKMEGTWHVHRPGSRWRRPAHEARVVLRTATREAVGFALGIVDLLPTAEEDRAVGHLGPDLLGPDWDEDEAVRRVRAEDERAIGDALLDQRCLAGIGTIYRSETLFLSGVSPFLLVPQVPDVGKVVKLARRLLLANREHPQITTTGDPRRGERLWIYGRSGQRCLRCATPVRRGEMGPEGQERVVYWCPSCQPGLD